MREDQTVRVMHSAVPVSPVRIAARQKYFRAERWMKAALCGLLILASGCGLFARTLRVEAGAVAEVRSIGSVVAEKSQETYMEGGVDVIETLVIDLGSKSADDLLDKSSTLLGKRGWVISAENRPISLYMRSGKWKGVILGMRPFDPDYLRGDPDLLRKVQSASVQPEKLVIIDAFAQG